MDKKYIVDQLKILAEKYDIEVSEDMLGTIVGKATFRVIPKGEIISSIGNDTSVAGFVLSGLARCYYIDGDGNDITRGFSPVGAMCMDEGFFGYLERICMWEALEESTIMFCKTADIRELLRANPDFKDIWITLLESGMRYKIYRENGFLVENATERYLHFKKQFPGLCERVAQKHIATYLGITPESLCRIKNSLKDT